MSSQWLTQEVDDGVVHVVPLDDQVEHGLTEDCVCGPTTELVLNEDAPDGHVHVHHSLDGREQEEVPDA